MSKVFQDKEQQSRRDQIVQTLGRKSISHWDVRDVISGQFADPPASSATAFAFAPLLRIITIRSCFSSSYISSLHSLHQSSTTHTLIMSATGYTIHVSGLAPETTEEKLHDFFSVSLKSSPLFSRS